MNRAKKTDPLQVSWVHPSKLTLDPSNVRKHSDKNLDAIRASLKRFGWQAPLIVDSKMIVRAGNGRLMIARQEEMNSVPIVVSDLPLSELTAYAIADNRTAELAEWDMKSLDSQLQALSDDGFDLDGMGFSEDDLAELFKGLDDGEGGGGEGSTKEIDEDEFSLDHKCPKCGFEFNDPS